MKRRRLWLWALLLLLAAILFFVLTGNDAIVPLVYR